MTDPAELFESFLKSERAQARYRDRNENRDRVRNEELLPLLNQFLDGAIPLDEFKPRNDGLNKQYPYWGFDGFNGQMHFNQIVNAAGDMEDLSEHLRTVLQFPEDPEAAARAISDHAERSRRYRNNSHESKPRYKPAMFFLSYFWHLQAPTEYPVFYVTSERYLESRGLFVQDGDYGDDYIEFIEVMDELIETAESVTDRTWEYRDISNAIYWHEELRPEWKEEGTGSTPDPEPAPVSVSGAENAPFLPPVVADLAAVAERDPTIEPQYTEQGMSLAPVFEDKLHTAFRMLGFDVTELGQGAGRQPDGIATAVRNNYAVIYDAKIRQDGYSVNTDDRAIREYIEMHTRRLHDTGTQQIYFAVISSSFTEPDYSTLRDIQSTTAIENIVFLPAEVLEALIVLRLREPYINLEDLQAVFGTRDGIFHREELNNVIPDWLDVTVEQYL